MKPDDKELKELFKSSPPPEPAYPAYESFDDEDSEEGEESGDSLVVTKGKKLIKGGRKHTFDGKFKQWSTNGQSYIATAKTVSLSNLCRKTHAMWITVILGF